MSLTGDLEAFGLNGSIDSYDPGLAIMKQKTFQFSFPCPEALFPEVVHQLGYPYGRAVSEEVEKEIHRAIPFCQQQIHPQTCYKDTPFLTRKKGVFTGQDLQIHSRRWANLVGRLENPAWLCCFLVTLGKGFDHAAADLQKDSLFPAYLLDAVGSVVIEQMSGQMTRYLAGMMSARGYQSTARFSPGYCDWELKSGQNALFSFLNPEKIGVELTSSGMMIPRKSISAVIIGAARVPWKTPCPSCSKGECVYRREE